MTAAHDDTTSSADREIVITRILDAPRELVWEAWTNQKHVEQWWGPRGFSNTFRAFDVKTGGVWRFVMHGPDGRDYPNWIAFDEVVKPERLDFAHGGNEGESAHFHVRVTFEDQDGKTKLTMRSIFPTAAARDQVVKEYGALEGGNQTVDRLEEHLAAMRAVFTLTRVLDAPRTLVWKAFTDPEHMQRWWGPKGTTGRIVKMDFRPGGSYHYCLRSPDGQDTWGRCVYREIAAPERLVFINSFSDETGGLAPHPMSPDWPLEIMSTFTFAEHEGKTTFTLTWSPYRTTEAGRKTFEKGRQGVQQGWTGSLDQLSAYLAEARKTENS